MASSSSPPHAAVLPSDSWQGVPEGMNHEVALASIKKKKFQFSEFFGEC